MSVSDGYLTKKTEAISLLLKNTPHRERFGEENPLAEKNILEQKLF